MPKFQIDFCDGRSIVKDAQDGNEAKRIAKHERAQALPPDTPRSAPEIKVARVTRVE